MLWLALILGACSTLPPDNPEQRPHRNVAALLSLPATDALLLGEQHDAADHQDIHRQVTATLVARARLAALVVEMADQGRSSRGLARDASEDEVRQRLVWNEKAWAWERYAPAIMAAVRSGLEVAGGNLPRSAMADAMRDATLDRLLAPSLLEQQRQDIRDGHCGLLPEAQIVPMTRIQIARDRSMAHTVLSLAQAGRLVLLLAGSAHVDRSAGVPAHWPSGFRSISVRLLPAGAFAAEGRFDQLWNTAAVAPRDYCAELKGQLKPATRQP